MATIKPFLEPRLTGARFDGGVIPLELLADLAALEELVVEVAKWKCRLEHPRLKRLPRGFTDGVTLTLTGIKDGSARPVIELVLAAGTLFPLAAEPYFDEARVAITSAVGAADQGGQVTAYLPEHFLGYFNRIGRHLKSGEVLELPTGDGTAPARLTQESRRRLVLAATREAEVSESVLLYGSITELDLTTKTFHLQTLDGVRAKGAADPQHMDALMDAFTGYHQSGAKVALVGSGCYSRANKLERIEAVEHISPLDPLDLTVRFHELKQLRPGWLNGRGLPPKPEALEELAVRFDAVYPADLPLPFVYPTAEGGVRAEWSLAGHEISLDIDQDGRRGDWHCLYLDGDQTAERSLRLDSPDDWQWLAGQLRHLIEAGG